MVQLAPELCYLLQRITDRAIFLPIRDIWRIKGHFGGFFVLHKAVNVMGYFCPVRDILEVFSNLKFYKGLLKVLCNKFVDFRTLSTTIFKLVFTFFQNICLRSNLHDNTNAKSSLTPSYLSTSLPH